MKLLHTVMVMLLVQACPAAGPNMSGNVLSNGGFENKDFSENANNAFGVHPWFTANRGGNVIAAAKEAARRGAYGLKWGPVGWNVKDDGAAEDAHTYMVNDCRPHLTAGACRVRFSGYINTSELGLAYGVQAVIANNTFSRFKFGPVTPGGASGWAPFNVSIPLEAQDQFVIAALKVVNTTDRGAGDGVVFIDDVALAYDGAAVVPAAEPAAEAVVVRPVEVENRPFYMGFTPFPWDISAAAVESTYKGITENGDMVCHHFDGGVPWPEALADAPFSKHIQDDWKTHRDNTPAGFKVYLALTPLNMFRKGMALYHGDKENMPLPKAFENRRFDDPEVMTAYLNYCRRAVKYFACDYLAIGIEVNELFHNTPEAWPAFVRLYKHVYAGIKKDHPRLPVFATFTLHNMLQTDWADVDAQRRAVKALLPDVDIVGISFYPFMKSLGAPERPVGSFDWILDFAGDKPLAVCETGFPAEATYLEDFNVTLPGSPAAQAAYFETLLHAAGRDRYLFVIAFLYRDYDALWDKLKLSMSGDWAAAWRDCGLVDGAGRDRPAKAVWRSYLKALYTR